VHQERMSHGDGGQDGDDPARDAPVRADPWPEPLGDPFDGDAVVQVLFRTALDLRLLRSQVDGEARDELDRLLEGLDASIRRIRVAVLDHRGPG
jgi:hypothetical protein